MIRAALAAALLLACLVAPSVAAAQSGPQLRGAKSAIVIEASTGQAAYKRDAGDRRQIASTTKMMTALVTLQHADLDDVFRASNYDPAPIESQIGLRPGERMSVRDLMRGLLLPSGNDAAMALAVGVSGSRNAFVRAMNTDAEQLGLRDTHFANPIGLDAPTNYSTAADLAKLAVVLRRNDFARETMDRRRATLQTGSRERTVDQPQHARPGVPVGQRGEDGPHELRRLPARRIGDPQRHHGRERRHGGAQRGRPRRRLADAAALRPQQLLAPDRAAEGRGARQAQARVPRRARRPRRLVGGPGGRRAAASGSPSRCRTSRPSCAVRSPPGHGSAPPSCAWADGSSGACRSSRRRRSARPRVTDRFKDANGPVILAVVVALLVVGSLLVMGLRRRAARRRRAVRRRERRAA